MTVSNIFRFFRNRMEFLKKSLLLFKYVYTFSSSNFLYLELSLSRAFSISNFLHFELSPSRTFSILNFLHLELSLSWAFSISSFLYLELPPSGIFSISNFLHLKLSPSRTYMETPCPYMVPTNYHRLPHQLPLVTHGI